jgi:RNA polymerase sigma factor (sigma-70 family)
MIVGGAHVEEATFLGELAVGRREAERVLLRQLSEDVGRNNGYSLALLCIERAFRSRVLGWLTFRWFQGDLALAEEAWDDALYRIWTRNERYDTRRSSFHTWIWNQARYAALDVLRRPYLEGQVVASGDEKAPEQPSERGGRGTGDLLADALQKAAKRESEEPPLPLTKDEVRAVRRAMARLTITEQRLLHFRYVLGLSHVEIARSHMTELPEEYVRVYVARSLKRLRRFYAEELELTSESGRPSQREGR